MQTEPNTRRPDSGFTLIEVLISLLILAIGLLGVEALGIGAVRMNARSDAQSGLLSVAADSLEVMRLRLTNNPPPHALSRTSGTLPDGATVHRSVTSAGAATPNLWRIRVTVVPAAKPHVIQPRDSVSLTADVFRP